MSEASRKISIRLRSDLHEKVEKLREVQPQKSTTAVIEACLDKAFAPEGFPVETQILLASVLADLGALLDLFNVAQQTHNKGDIAAFDSLTEPTLDTIRHVFDHLLERLVHLDEGER